MSIWQEIESRASGEVTRKEDKIIFPEVKKVCAHLIGKQIFDMDVIGEPNGVNNLTQCGSIVYYVNEDVSVDGETLHKGDLIVDDGNDWHTISHNDMTTISYNDMLGDFIGQ